jgi:hypothetical protein
MVSVSSMVLGSAEFVTPVALTDMDDFLEFGA